MRLPIPNSALLLLLWTSLGISMGFAGCASAPASPPEIGQFYVVHCTILGNRGEIIKSFPAAKTCIFLDDGTFIAASDNPRRLGRIDSHGRLMWTRDIPIHHQLKLSADGKKILTLGADIREGDLGRIRYDDFLILSVDTGETLYRWSGYEHRKEYLTYNDEVHTHIRPPNAREGLDYLYEYTHFNSICEIPENPTASVIPAFRKGGYLVGLNGIGTFAILDPELKKIIWTMPDPMFDGDTGHNLRKFHDAQVLPNGHLLVFNNELGPSTEQAYFGIREIDPVSLKIVWQYPRKSQVVVGGAGGVQVLPEGYLFNTNFMLDGRESGAAFLIDPSGHTLWSLQEIDAPGGLSTYQVGTTPVDEIKTRGKQFQDIKKVDVRQFLDKTAL